MDLSVPLAPSGEGRMLASWLEQLIFGTVTGLRIIPPWLDATLAMATAFVLTVPTVRRLRSHPDARGLRRVARQHGPGAPVGGHGHPDRGAEQPRAGLQPHGHRRGRAVPQQRQGIARRALHLRQRRHRLRIGRVRAGRGRGGLAVLRAPRAVRLAERARWRSLAGARRSLARFALESGPGGCGLRRGAPARRRPSARQTGRPDGRGREARR